MSITVMKQMANYIDTLGGDSKKYRQAIAEAENQTSASEVEPVAWLHKQGNFTEACMNALHDDEIDRGWTQQPLYTSPPQRQPLTDERIGDIAALFYAKWRGHEGFARAIEAAHNIFGDKND